MTVETTIQRMFSQCPGLFSTRRECYNFLFCVIGTGYKWRRGQIVYLDHDDDESAEEADYAAMRKEWDDCGLSPNTAQSEEDIRRHDGRMERVHDAERNFKWYPLCEYSLINNVPDDVKPDWKAAVEECKLMMEKDGGVLGNRKQKRESEAK